MRAVCAGLLVGVLGTSATATASPELYESPRRPRELTIATPRRAATAFGALAQRGWRATWDRETGVPAWLWGGRVEIPGSVDDADIAERAARAFLTEQLGVLAPGATAHDFTLLANHLDRGTRTITFAQTWRGLRVDGGAIGFVFAHDRLAAVRSAARSDVSAVMPAARDALAQPRVERSVGERVRATGEREVIASGTGYRVADVYENERWRVHASASGEVLATRSKIMFAAGTLEYNAGIRWGGGARTTFPAPSASILVNTISTLTMADGTFTWSGVAPATVVTAVFRTYVRVINNGGASAMQTLGVVPAGTAVWDASAIETEDAQVSTYIYANIAKARARIVNPAVSAWLDTQTNFRVNDNGSCNASSDGNDVRLFKSNAMCANTGLVGDVVFHEFGHAFHNHSAIPGMGAFETHLSEGLADFFASNITGDPGMGRGFFKTDEPLRQIDPPGFERVHPQDLDFDPHVSGLIIAGALWDLRKALVATLGTANGVTRAEQIFTGVMQRADDIGVTFTAALLADDDDGDLGNGTPNDCAIENAFGRHGLVPGFVATSVTAPMAVGRQITMHVTTPSGTACPPLGVSSIKVTWNANDGVPSELALVPTGSDWAGEFPEHPDGTLISYSVDVTYVDGSLESFPNNPADPHYQLFIGEGTPLFCEPFDTEPNWEETSNLGREWQWAPPLVDLMTPDPDAPYSGTYVFGTDVTSDGAYRANLGTSITTPLITVPAFETVRLQYRRWLTIEDGAFDEATIEANGTEVWHNASAQNGTLDHIDREWRYHDIDITPWVTEGSLQLTWRLDSDFGKQFGGWTIDDVCVVGLAKIAACGDSEVDIGEQCDDGNRESGDGCDAKCIDEVTGGGGGGCCSSSGSSSGGSGVLALTVLGWIYRRRRASSLVPSRSVSDRMP